MELLNRNKTPKELSAGDIREKYDKSQRAMQSDQWNFVLNRLFVHGDQWLYADRPRNTVRPYPRDPSRVRLTVNKLWPATRHLMAKLLSRDMIFEVPPTETDDASIRGSMTSEAALADLQFEHKWEELRERIAWDTWLGGTAALALDWDASAGPTLEHDQFGNPVGTGEIIETALTVLEVAWEPGTKDAERGTWWIRACALPPSEVAEMYDLGKEPSADASAAFGYVGRSLDSSNTAMTPLTLVLTYYQRPTKRNPKGCVKTVIGDKIVEQGPWPFPWEDKLNMVVFRETKVAGKATGETVLTSAVPIQTAYNAAWSNLVEHLKLSGNARLMIPDSAIDGIDELTDLPAEILQYNSQGGAPSWLTPAPLPAWVIEQPLMLGQQIDDIVGLHDVSRGSAPKNVESGIGISVLVEQDTTPLGALTKELAAGFSRYASMVLELYSAKVNDTRYAKVHGTKEVGPQVVPWTGKSLAGQTRAVVPLDSVMPRSRAALMAFAKELWDRKIIVDPAMFAKVADLPSHEYLIDSMDRDASKAQRENQAMALGEICVPAEFDNHGTHIKRHNDDLRKTLRYETLDEAQRTIIDKHVLAHEIMAAEEMGKQVAKMNVNPALAASATSQEAAPLPPGMEPPPQEVPGMPPVPGPPAQGSSNDQFAQETGPTPV